MDEFYDDDEDRPWSSMSSRPGSAESRPGTARLRPSAYGREGSTLDREDSDLNREMTIMDIFQDAEYLKRKSDDPLAMEETSFFDNDGFEGDEPDTGLYRSDTQMSFEPGLAPDSKKAQRALLETPRPESARPEEEPERVPTPMMMKGLEEVCITSLLDQ